MAIRYNLKGLIAKKELETGERITITEVSKAVEIPRTTLYRLIAGKGKWVAKKEYITRLCKYFECEEADLIKIFDEGIRPDKNEKQNQNIDGKDEI